MTILSHDRMTIDRVLDWWLDLLDTSTAHDYTLQIIITHRLAFSATLLGNNFQWKMFLCFRAHVLAGRQPSHTRTTGFSWYFLRLLAPGLNSSTAASRLSPLTGSQPTSNGNWSSLYSLKTDLLVNDMLLTEAVRHMVYCKSSVKQENTKKNAVSASQSRDPSLSQTKPYTP
jgi:hypothetical protein